jgi:hypothetical protein
MLVDDGAVKKLNMEVRRGGRGWWRIGQWPCAPSPWSAALPPSFAMPCLLQEGGAFTVSGAEDILSALD